MLVSWDSGVSWWEGAIFYLNYPDGIFSCTDLETIWSHYWQQTLMPAKISWILVEDIRFLGQRQKEIFLLPVRVKTGVSGVVQNDGRRASRHMPMQRGFSYKRNCDLGQSKYFVYKHFCSLFQKDRWSLIFQAVSKCFLCSWKRHYVPRQFPTSLHKYS